VGRRKSKIFCWWALVALSMAHKNFPTLTNGRYNNTMAQIKRQIPNPDDPKGEEGKGQPII
jgi:hypothetical protein